MSDFFGKLKSGAEKVAFEADKMTRLNRAKSELEKVKGQIQAQYMKLGEMYFTRRISGGVTGPEFDEICQAVSDLEQQVVSKDEEVQRINAETFGQPGSQPAPQPTQTPAVPPVATPAAPVQATTKFCPNCGKENLAAAKFCTDCGTSF
jgi:hypothetical protein